MTQPPDLSHIYSPTTQNLPVPNFHLIKQPDTPLRRELNIRNQMTPGAEFNTYADSVAAARVFALTSLHPKSTMPPLVKGKRELADYPEGLLRKLRVKLFPLGMVSFFLHTLP
jgi:hypothetical protein